MNQPTMRTHMLTIFKPGIKPRDSSGKLDAWLKTGLGNNSSLLCTFTPSSVAMKLTNIASQDPQITASGRKGLQGASDLDRSVWTELQSDWDSVATEAAHAWASF